jgi:hypothetical protein
MKFSRNPIFFCIRNLVLKKGRYTGKTHRWRYGGKESEGKRQLKRDRRKETEGKRQRKRDTVKETQGMRHR